VPVSAHSALKIGRWILTGLVVLTLFSVGRTLAENELALPILRAEAVEGMREDASASDLYTEALDSLGVRLAERQTLSPETDSTQIEALGSEIELWQTRMGNIIRYRALSKSISKFRLYSWVALGLLSLMLAALVLVPRWRRRSRQR
jgi:hypothetical protein